MIKYLCKIFTEYRQSFTDVLWQFLYVAGKHLFILGIFLLCFFFLDTYNFGLYNYVIAVLLLFVMFADFGISFTSLKYIAEFRALNSKREHSVLFNGLLFALIPIGFSVLLVLLFAPHFLHERYIYMYTLIPSLVFLPLGYVYAGIYRGIGRFKAAAKITLSVGLVCLIFAFFVIQNYGLMGALWMNNIFALLLCLVFAFCYREWNIQLDIDLIKKMGSYSIVLGVTGLSYYLYSRVDVILLGKFGYIQEIGFYELVNKFFLILGAPFMILAQTIAPKIAAMHAKREFEKVLYTYKQLMLLSFLGALMLTAISFLIIPIVIDSYFPQYQSLIKAFSFLLMIFITQSVSAVTAIGFSTVTGHAKTNMIFLIVFGIVNIPLTYILISRYGFMGAVYSTVIIRLLTDLLFVRRYSFLLKKKFDQSLLG